jgi:tetratricopeptide (TPR) repeat protein
MKYWWTLGCFPTGLERPFRLNEFLSTYTQQHVPAEVEDWLKCFLKNPFEELKDATSELLIQLEEVPFSEKTRGYHSIEATVAAFASPLAKFEKQLSVRIPSLAVRAALGSPILRERLKDDLYEYKEALSESGSTPHRRLARIVLEAPLAIESNEERYDNTEFRKADVPVALGQAVGSYVSPDAHTAPDEKKLLRLLTTLSEGCVLKNDYESAFSILSSSLSFSHDDCTDSVVHANASAAALLNGQFKEAEFHGRQAALLEPQLESNQKAGGRGYALWATATAFQDDFERATRITRKGIELYPASTELRELNSKLASIQTVDVPSALKGRVVRCKAQQSRGLLHGSGKSFDNEFDWVVFKNKLYPSKMDPSTNEMGSVFRRVGDLGGHISTSRSTEVL